MFLTRRFYIALAVAIVFIGSGYLFTPLSYIGTVLFIAVIVLGIVDYGMLYAPRVGMEAKRVCSERFSNGDDNKVTITLQSAYCFGVRVEVIDETPFVFQCRHLSLKIILAPDASGEVHYTLRPVKRGVYSFGSIRVFVSDRIGLVVRRYTCGQPLDIKVYPSFLMLHQYELLAISNNLKELGIKRIRRAGQHTEFEQIKEYVKDDDFRHINWQASARRHLLMVNVFQDERSQRIYNIIDKGRVMQQAFRGMTLLDYAINASLMLSYVAMRKEDKAGLVTFDERFDTFVPASKQNGHLQALLENLYAQQTTFGESDYSALCVNINKHLNQRSLLVIYTNFANMKAMNRELIYLQQLSRRHKLLVVFFEDVELKTYLTEHPKDTEGYFQHVIAEKFAYEKRLIVSTLQQHGIYSLLTTPDNLSVDVINKYLELKSRQVI